MGLVTRVYSQCIRPVASAGLIAWLLTTISCTSHTNHAEALPEPPPQTLIESFQLGSRVIHREELTDTVLPLLKRYKSDKPTVLKDPDITGSLIVDQYFRLNGKEYRLVCKR